MKKIDFFNLNIILELINLTMFNNNDFKNNSKNNSNNNSVCDKCSGYCFDKISCLRRSIAKQKYKNSELKCPLCNHNYRVNTDCHVYPSTYFMCQKCSDNLYNLHNFLNLTDKSECLCCGIYFDPNDSYDPDSKENNTKGLWRVVCDTECVSYLDQIIETYNSEFPPQEEYLQNTEIQRKTPFPNVVRIIQIARTNIIDNHKLEYIFNIAEGRSNLSLRDILSVNLGLSDVSD